MCPPQRFLFIELLAADGMKPSKWKDFSFSFSVLDLIQICWEPRHYYNEVTETQSCYLYCILGSTEYIWLILYREAFVPHSIYTHCMTIFTTEAIYLWWLLPFPQVCMYILRVTAISNCDTLTFLLFKRPPSRTQHEANLQYRYFLSTSFA